MAKVITVVPPTMLVTMFGVPESVSLPSKVGEEVVFMAHGKRWFLKRVRTDCYFLSAPLNDPRCRFGTATEIAEDVGRVLETGALPRCKERFC